MIMILTQNIQKWSAAVFLLLFSLLPNFLSSQIEKPVRWCAQVTRISDTEAELKVTATIDKGWHVYAMDPGGEGTETGLMVSVKGDGAISISDPKEIGTIEEKVFPDIGPEKYRFFEKTVELVQLLKVSGAGEQKATGFFSYQICNDEMCLPPVNELEFDVIIPAAGTSSPNCFIDPGDKGPAVVETVTPTVTTAGITLSKVQNFEAGCGELKADESLSLWEVFFEGFFYGFIALVMPCVFSMIPLTVSFFTKQSRSKAEGIRNAGVYGLSIILIFVLLGLVVTLISGSANLANEMASNVYFNLAFFVIFVVFALSFFGAFEITLPSSWINKADAASEKGGLIGIFFMAFTLVLVSFTCTGPIIGNLLVQAAQGHYLHPLFGMTGFAVALALPFTVFAIFPGWLNTLPKSGGWLNVFKVSLGFIELAFALKFLSNVDLAYHWDFLKRELFIALWIVIFGMWGIYLLGLFKLSHDSDSKHISTARVFLAVVVLGFTLYLIPGMFGAPVRLISGFPPPSYYREWKDPAEKACPHNLDCYHDLEAGMAYAKEVGKPVMIDFTGYSCVNCRRMEDNVWPDSEILPLLRDQYVVISLYVDDKDKLEKERIALSDGKTKVKTKGQLWSDLEAFYYGQNSQPLYVLVDNEGKMLAKPMEYTDVETYKKFLEEGLCRYSKRKKN